MMSNYAHIHPKFQHVMELSDAERIDFIRSSRWIGYSKAQEIIQQLEDLLTYPKRPRMPNLLLIGESNNGKTTLIRHFFNKNGVTYQDEDLDLIIPIILIEAPNTASEKALYITLLENMVAPYRKTSTVEILYTQTLHLMRTYAVKMLIIDEFHSMFSGTARKQREMMNALKRLCNELQIPIVGVGTENAANILYTDKQFASRFEICELPGWNLDNDFKRMLASFESILPLQNPSNLKDTELAQAIYYKAKGNLGNTHNLLIRCAVEAIRNKSEIIDLKSIKAQKDFLSTIKGRV
ncbi:TniB family NTP-binding protein [Neisseria chenwenguii]|uniref:TniB family NTP-binding protein n=1 Tax=Neisseria chenwenguii TaxID=1853278 RepID=UPI000F4EE575|nr:TniB family NTP-binding protein [Neisseria chenwenguii]ROV53848.1 AAA family ATPase [Neisseria chenwenguii]